MRRFGLASGAIALNFGLLGGVLVALGGCGDDSGAEAGTASSAEGVSTTVPDTSSGEGNTAEQGDGDGDTGPGDGDGDGDGDPGDGDGEPIKFDMSLPDTSDQPPPDLCKVVDDMNAVGECEESAPPDAFVPELQWAFTDNAEPYSYVTPLVANFTDDDDNGEIDLCDIPDVVLVAASNPGPPSVTGHIFLLSGADGSLHFRINDPVDSSFTPALGDIDNDGLVEIVTVSPSGNLMAFEHTGELAWSTPTTWDIGESFGQDLRYSNSAALADVDNDGDVEIITANMLFDHQGALLHKFPQPSGQWGATTAADLDNDEDLEIVLGNAAYHHDGTALWTTNLASGYPQVADLDEDGLPEVILTNVNGISLIEHNGVVTYSNLRPTGVGAFGTNWLRPATIHDFDGDGFPEFATSSASQYTVYEPDATIVWTAPVNDSSGIAAGTAFDFVAAGKAQAMYADQDNMFVFDGDGNVLLQQSRKSGTLSEYPVVVDVDNDGSAEILVVSNQHNGGGDPCIQVIKDVEDRWIQARRIWNQHSYHVTNVREDGTIPQFEAPAWEGLNTFRTNAQIEGGGLCMPPPAN
ncbi:FG-GAP repeat domain-containing protein [Enhygromyxa salina]|uniref:FG-GAP repeat protein n=1 Tax=Enhygromyxa salina TaxID=215803 RepID=A0A2S9YRT3_9BACT|nr:VCBS repeat-containing protein [Enhygromyxa salina]PRQ07788.1 FG-GAP repeat protein [Enhygromyxa salina]